MPVGTLVTCEISFHMTHMSLCHNVTLNWRCQCVSMYVSCVHLVLVSRGSVTFDQRTTQHTIRVPEYCCYLPLCRTYNTTSAYVLSLSLWTASLKTGDRRRWFSSAKTRVFSISISTVHGAIIPMASARQRCSSAAEAAAATVKPFKSESPCSRSRSRSR